MPELHCGDGYFEFISNLLDLIHQEFPIVLADFQVYVDSVKLGATLRKDPVV
jgi:hypothetical protein